MNWKPIETAPKDGTRVDLWIVGGDDNVDFYEIMSIHTTHRLGQQIIYSEQCPAALSTTLSTSAYALVPPMVGMDMDSVLGADL